MSGEWTLKRLLSEVIGSGPRSAEDMTREQAREAFSRILAQEADPTTLGAFLLANRWKGNTPVELGAFLDVMIEESVERAAPAASVVDCGANYDGKAKTAVLGVGAGVVAAAGGAPTVVHSADRVPTKEAGAYKHVLDALGVKTDLGPGASARMVEETGFGFYYQPACNPGIHALLDRRRQMGVRTAINTIETLANPANADVHLGSFYHLTFAKKLVETLEESEHAGFERAIFFQGIEGYDDVRPGHTTVVEWEGDGLEESAIETDAFGLDIDTDDLAVADVPQDSATITREVLAGDRTDRFADAIALNAGVRLYAGGGASDIDEGYRRAQSLVADGAALDTLEAIRAFEP